MGLISIPTRTSGSLGAEKFDAQIPVYSNTILPAGEYNTGADAIVGVTSEVGLHSGTTSGSLVAKVKEFIRLDTSLSGTSQFNNSNPMPSPSINTGWVNPTITSSNSTVFAGGKILELRADGAVPGSSAFNTAIWWFDQKFPFQSTKIEYTQALGVSQSVPGGSDVVMAGVIVCGDITYGSGIGSLTGFFAGVPSTYLIRSDLSGSGSGSLFYSSSVGAYASKTEFDLFGARTIGTAPVFFMKYSGMDVLGDSASSLMASAQIGFTSASWISGSCDRVGVCLFGSSSGPVTMSLMDLRIYPRPGDPGFSL